jgi:hypothetical protein
VFGGQHHEAIWVTQEGLFLSEHFEINSELLNAVCVTTASYCEDLKTPTNKI